MLSFGGIGCGSFTGTYNPPSGAPPDLTAPVLLSAIIGASGLSLTLTYDEALDTGSTPATGDFALAGTSSTITGVNVTGSTVVLTLSPAIFQGVTGITLSYTPGANKIRDLAANNAAALTSQAVTNNSTTNLTPPVAGYAAWFDSDQPTQIAYNPNFRYPGHANLGSLSGDWTTSSYDARPRRHKVTYNSGALERWLSYSNGATARPLIFGGTKSTHRFHDGTGGVTFYLALTRRSIAAATGHDFLISASTATAVGLRIRGVAGQQQIQITIGNGSATVLTLTSAGTEFATDMPHVVAITLHTYSGVGSLGATMRIDDGTPVTANWTAAPSASDSAAALQIGGTHHAHIGSVLIYHSLKTLGGADDIAITDFLQDRFVGTPDPWTTPKIGFVLVEGDSIPTGVGGTPVIEQCTFDRPFDYQRISTAGHYLITDINTTGNQNAINTIFDAHSDAAWRALWLDCGTNDITFQSATDTDVHNSMLDLVADLRAARAWDAVCVANIRHREGMTAPQKAYVISYRDLLAANHTNIDGVIDAYTLTSNPTLHPEYFEPGGNPTHPSTLGNAQSVPATQAAYNAALPAAASGEDFNYDSGYDYLASDGTTIDHWNGASISQSGGVVTGLTLNISGVAQTIVNAPAYDGSGPTPAMAFDGVNDLIRGSVAALVAAGQGRAVTTIAYVVKFNVASASGTVFGWAKAGSNSHKRSVGQSSLSSGRYDARLNGVSTAGSTVVTVDKHTVIISMNGTTITQYIDGEVDPGMNGIPYDPGTTFAPDRYAWGGVDDASADTFGAFRIHEWLEKDGAMDAAAAARLNRALKYEHGIA